jgi:hypothetical protein
LTCHDCNTTLCNFCDNAQDVSITFFSCCNEMFCSDCRESCSGCNKDRLEHDSVCSHCEDLEQCTNCSNNVCQCCIACCSFCEQTVYSRCTEHHGGCPGKRPAKKIKCEQGG